MKNNALYIVLFFYIIAATLTIIFFNGTGDAGDSVLHYQFAKFAPQHPALYFNHWAKPFYVLLASPFAQFGFIGIKVFNVIISALTIFFTCKIAQKLNLKNALFSALILISCPLYFVLTFSGLTELLFALFICMGLYTVLKQKFIWACLIISFLPFIRSEGLIIMGIFGLYFLLKNKWKLLPFLLFGHLAYSIAGFFVHNDFLWIFNKIPYAHLDSTYGSGELFHFVEKLIYITGVPIYILFWIGCFAIIWKSVRKRLNLEIQVLVFIGFFAFFMAHTLFWYLGIFNSMGLKRVLIGVAPLIALISLMGFNLITEDVFKSKKKPKLITQGILVLYVLIFPFTSNPAAIHWNWELNLSKDQETAIQVTDFIKQNTIPHHRFIYAHPYLSEALNIDHFDKNKRLALTNTMMNRIQTGDIIIWENWFAVVEQKVTKKDLDDNSDLIKLYNLSVNDNGREIIYAVYQRK